MAQARRVQWRVIRVRRDGEVERLTEMGAGAKARRDIELLYQLAWHGRAFGALVCAGCANASLSRRIRRWGRVAPRTRLGA